MTADSDSHAQELEWQPGWHDTVSGVTMVGTTEPDTGAERFILSRYSHARQWAVPSRPLTKDEIEIWHIGQLAADFQASSGQALFEFGVTKSEHPDFLVNLRDGRPSAAGIELVSFTPPERRRIEAALTPLRATIKRRREELLHLAGCNVQLLPDPLPSSAQAAQVSLKDPEQIVDGLVGLVRPAAMPDFSGGFPEEFPPGHFSSSVIREGLRATCNEVVPQAQAIGDVVWGTPRVQPIFQILTSPDGVISDLAERIQQHAYAETLVVVVGGPGRDGAGMIEDGMLLRAALDESSVSLPPVDEDRRVLLHWWDDGTVEQLLPQRLTLSGPVHERGRPLTVLQWAGRAAVCFVPAVVVLGVSPAD